MTFDKSHEMHQRRRSRNHGVLIALVAFACLLFAVTIVKLGPNAGNPSAGVSWPERLEKWLTE